MWGFVMLRLLQVVLLCLLGLVGFWGPVARFWSALPAPFVPYAFAAVALVGLAVRGRQAVLAVRLALASRAVQVGEVTLRCPREMTDEAEAVRIGELVAALADLVRRELGVPDYRPSTVWLVPSVRALRAVSGRWAAAFATRRPRSLVIGGMADGPLFRSALTHELTHDAAWHLGPYRPIVKAEGLAHYVASRLPEVHGRPAGHRLHRVAGVLLALGALPRLRRLLWRGGLAAPPLLYEVGGSLTGFLLEELGLEGYLRAYGARCWRWRLRPRRVLGRPMAEVDRRWRDRIAAEVGPDADFRRQATMLYCALRELVHRRHGTALRWLQDLPGDGDHWSVAFLRGLLRAEVGDPQVVLDAGLLAAAAADRPVLALDEWAALLRAWPLAQQGDWAAVGEVLSAEPSATTRVMPFSFRLTLAQATERLRAGQLQPTDFRDALALRALLTKRDWLARRAMRAARRIAVRERLGPSGDRSSCGP